MIWMIAKYFVTAGVVVIVSEVAKRSDRLGSLIASLPLVTILVLIWLHLEQQSTEKVANHAWYTFWYVVPTLSMFLVFTCSLSRFVVWVTIMVYVVLSVFLSVSLSAT